MNPVDEGYEEGWVGGAGKEFVDPLTNKRYQAGFEAGRTDRASGQPYGHSKGTGRSIALFWIAEAVWALTLIGAVSRPEWAFFLAMLGALVGIPVIIAVFVDAQDRYGGPAWLWGVGVLFLQPLFLPVYLIYRARVPPRDWLDTRRGRGPSGIPVRLWWWLLPWWARPPGGPGPRD